MSIPMRTLHYNSVTTGNGGPWNGFATIAETYQKFDEDDQRRDIFLVGPQFSFDDGRPINDRGGARLDFTVTISDAEAAAENEGARYNKFPPTSGVPNGDSHPNDFPLFRLAEMYLIKAEAYARLGQLGPATTELNRVHSRNFTPPEILAPADADEALDLILDERLFEFAGEAKRRQDQLQTNPLLVQNPGY
jgi:hypothetical protein